MKTEILVGVEANGSPSLVTTIYTNGKFVFGVKSSTPWGKSIYISADNSCPINDDEIIRDGAKDVAKTLKKQRIRIVTLTQGERGRFTNHSRVKCLKLPPKELNLFVTTLKRCLRKGTRVVT